MPATSNNVLFPGPAKHWYWWPDTLIITWVQWCYSDGLILGSVHISGIFTMMHLHLWLACIHRGGVCMYILTDTHLNLCVSWNCGKCQNYYAPEKIRTLLYTNQSIASVSLETLFARHQLFVHDRWHGEQGNWQVSVGSLITGYIFL